MLKVLPVFLFTLRRFPHSVFLRIFRILLHPLPSIPHFAAAESAVQQRFEDAGVVLPSHLHFTPLIDNGRVVSFPPEALQNPQRSALGGDAFWKGVEHLSLHYFLFLFFLFFVFFLLFFFFRLDHRRGVLSRPQTSVFNFVYCLT